LDPANRHQYEEDLRHALQKLLEIPEDKDFAFTEGKLSERLTNKGYIALLGRTPPLRELMLWRRQTSRNFEVVLPDDRYVSHVYLLDDFSSLGWTAWATCDHRATGGWATEKALFAPVPRYKHGIQGSEFKAVFLTHETQHLADKNRFEKMKPWELEYRAKLAELWAADANVASERISKFQDSQSDDPALAHSFANRQVLIDLTKYLSKDVAVATLSELHAAAKALLIADSKKRRVHNS
jgi:hypothetical protein